MKNKHAHNTATFAQHHQSEWTIDLNDNGIDGFRNCILVVNPEVCLFTLHQVFENFSHSRTSERQLHVVNAPYTSTWSRRMGKNLPGITTWILLDLFIGSDNWKFIILQRTTIREFIIHLKNELSLVIFLSVSQAWRVFIDGGRGGLDISRILSCVTWLPLLVISFICIRVESLQEMSTRCEKRLVVADSYKLKPSNIS